jgi:hypothetical protein
MCEEKIDPGIVKCTQIEMDFGSEEAGFANLVALEYILVIPPGTIIKSAFIQFRSSTDETAPLLLSISAHNIASAPQGNNNVGYDLSSRSKTATAVAWDVQSWWAEEESSCELSPDLSTIIQEIVDLPDWASGNRVMLLFEEPVFSGNARRAWVAQGAPLTVTFGCMYSWNIVCMQACMFACMHVQVYVCTYARMHVYM